MVTEDAARQGVQIALFQEISQTPYFWAEQNPRVWYEAGFRNAFPTDKTVKLMAGIVATQQDGADRADYEERAGPAFTSNSAAGV